jgi:hypothetical protein
MIKPQETSTRACENFHKGLMSIPDQAQAGRVVVLGESGAGARVGVQLAPPVSGSPEALPRVFLAVDCDASDISRLRRWLASRAPIRVWRNADVVELLQPRTGQRVHLRCRRRPLLAA